ncbi:helix-turn-helix transcriptional regulator [Marinobacterium jannaschii]|uniref:helix-turn-helix transcriptional regulator n=1 Tax=Marinobacterium jannaschii TaxID=64970 RepID=UPI000A0492AA|nr:helix-turn-helix transcriptional regulator [Marinobacterium jannaschii]
MTDKYLGTSDWYSLLARLVKHTGDQNCPHLLAKACQKVSGYNSTLITAYPRNRRPVHIYSNLPANQISRTLTPYFYGAYLLDPFYALCQNKAPSGIYRLADLAPDEFYESEYYHTYYAGTQLRDEAGIVISVTADLYIVVSLGLRSEDNESHKVRYQDLQTISTMLVSICEQFWSGNGIGMEMLGGAVDCIQPLYGESLDRTFMNFGRDFLSERECEVIRLILKGHSSKSIARVLDISPDTVKVHRKRFHAKLKVSSQAELFSLFLDAISLAPLNSDEDPLSFYFSQNACRIAS